MRLVTTPAAAIDTCALLAFLNLETGWEVVDARLDRGVVTSTLMVEELTNKLVQKGASREEAAVTVSEIGLATADLTMPPRTRCGRHGRRHVAEGSQSRRPRVPRPRSVPGRPCRAADCPWADVVHELAVTIELIR